MLHPVGEPPVSLFQPPPSIAQSYAFDWPVSEPRELLPVLARLTASAAGARDQRCCGRVTLRLQQQGRVPSCTAARILPEGVCEARRLLQTARTLLLDLLSERREVEVITLELGALRVAEARQGTLFARRPAVEAAVRVVERKYPGSLKRIVLRPHALFEEDRVLLLPFLSDGVSPNGHADG
jgi:hypothetical protein